jgi:pyruvate ferredoxin oxidoreductase gamma subunit
MKHVGRPLPNAALLGGFAAITGQLRIESVVKAIRDKFPGKVGESNARAAEEAYAACEAIHA